MQVVVQDARSAAWRVERQRPRHARNDVVLNDRTGGRATRVDPKITVDRETVDRDILTVYQVEGRRTRCHNGFTDACARPADTRVWP